MGEDDALVKALVDHLLGADGTGLLAVKSPVGFVGFHLVALFFGNEPCNAISATGVAVHNRDIFRGADGVNEHREGVSYKIEVAEVVGSENENTHDEMFFELRGGEPPTVVVGGFGLLDTGLPCSEHDVNGDDGERDGPHGHEGENE